MIFVTGPMFSGKYEYLQKTLGLTEEELAPRCARNVEKLAAGTEDLEELCARLASYDFVTASEVGCGWCRRPGAASGPGAGGAAELPLGRAGGCGHPGVLRPAPGT